MSNGRRWCWALGSPSRMFELECAFDRARDGPVRTAARTLRCFLFIRPPKYARLQFMQAARQAVAVQRSRRSPCGAVEIIAMRSAGLGHRAQGADLRTQSADPDFPSGASGMPRCRPPHTHGRRGGTEAPGGPAEGAASRPCLPDLSHRLARKRCICRARSSTPGAVRAAVEHRPVRSWARLHPRPFSAPPACAPVSRCGSVAWRS